MSGGYSFWRAGLGALVLSMALALLPPAAAAAGIRVVPSADRVAPGEDFYLDIVADDIPAVDGLGSVQFRLHVAAAGSAVAAVPDLLQAGPDAVAVASPLLVSPATATRSGLGDFFLAPYRGGSGILLLENEPLRNGSALYTYAHTSGATLPNGTGSVARFRVRVGSKVAAEQIQVSLSEVMLLDGGLEYPLDYNQGATITLRCTAQVPNLAGLSLAEAQSVLAASALTLGSLYEIDSPGGSRPLGVVLAQSATAGTVVDCETAVNLAINTAPAEVTGLVATDKAGDDTGTVLLAWSPSVSSDAAGYRIYRQGILLNQVADPQAAGAEVGGLANGASQALLVKAYDTYGNESAGAAVAAIPVDDVYPVVTISGVTEGSFYREPVQPQVSATDTNLDGWTALLGEVTYDFSPIAADDSYTLTVTARDLSGNATTESVSFTVDRTAPAITVANLSDGAHYNGDLIPAIAISDSNLVESLTALILDGENYLPGTAVTAEGPHLLAVSAEDRAGNRADLSLNFVIDRTAPLITLAGVIDGALYTIDVTPAVAFEDAHLLASALTLNGEPFTSGTTVTAEGAYTLAAQAEDRAGNRAEISAGFVIDKTAPISSAAVGDPQYAAGGILYVGTQTAVALTAVDGGAAPTGVATLEYALDQAEQWIPYAGPFTLGLLEEGERTVNYRSADQAGNVEEIRTLAVVLDQSSPQTAVIRSGASFVGPEGTIFVQPQTVFSLEASDDLSGAAETEYRLDSGPWQAYAPFTLPAEGEHLIEYRSTDRLGNQEEIQSLSFITDATPPESGIVFSNHSFLEGETVFVAADTEVTLTAVDRLSGVKGIQYRFDEELSWRSYYDPFRLADLACGTHLLHYRSLDNVENAEAEKTVPMVRIGIEVSSELLNLPRVLVWTAEPAKNGKQESVAAIEDIQAIVGDALGAPDIYFRLVTDQDLFIEQFRSGIYNVTMILDQDVPFDAGFLREMREAVYRGMGLLVSSWGNSVHPILQELFGLDFRGSLPMNEEERTIHLFESPVAREQDAPVRGSVLRTTLDGGTLAGIFPGESTCSGIRALSLSQAVEVRPGDRLTVSLAVPQGKKLNVIDEEQVTIDALPVEAVNRFTGHTGGDLAIDRISPAGIELSLATAYGYLGESYDLSLTLEHLDGTRSMTGPVILSPTCAASLNAGVAIGPFDVTGVEEDRVRSGDDLPALVLHRYGRGRTVFLAYDLVVSALAGPAGHLELLQGAAGWLLPEPAPAKAAEIVLVETTIRPQGAGMDLLAREVLGDELIPLPLFGLPAEPLEFAFDLEEEEVGVYRYFLRLPDRVGEFGKRTDIHLSLGGDFFLFDSYLSAFHLEKDAEALLLEAISLVDAELETNREATIALVEIRSQLEQIACLPGATAKELDRLIDRIVQLLHQVEQLPFDTAGLRDILGEYLRILESRLFLD